MLTGLIALVVGFQGQTQTPALHDPPYFTEVTLGKDGFEAFQNPDRVTVQRVFPAMIEPGELTIGKQKVHAAGAENTLPSEIYSKVTLELSKAQPPNNTLCGFHPDHVIRYRKGSVAIEIVTCFTCHVMIISKNGVHLNGGTLPWEIQRETLDRYIPVVEQQRAAVDEAVVWSGFYDALHAANSATAQAVEKKDDPRRIEWVDIGEPKALDGQSFEKLRQLIGSISMMQSLPVSYGSTQVAVLKSDVLITFNGAKQIKLLFNKYGNNPVIPILPNGKPRRPISALIREAFSVELSKFAIEK